MSDDPNVILREAMSLAITPDQALEFIFTPDRILDYSPSHTDGGVLEPGQSIYCTGPESTFLMERISPETDRELVVVKVHAAAALPEPCTADQIKEAAIFAMVEDWQLEPTDGGTLLTKTWRDLEQYQLEEIPMGPIVREQAEAETDLLVNGWNNAANGENHTEAGAGALATELVNAFGDPDAIVQLLTDDVEWWITPTVGVLPSPCRGRDNVAASMKVIFGDIYVDARPEIHMVIADGDRASVRFTLRATAKIAGNVPYENEYCIWVERQGDHIARVWEYLDVAHAHAQFGMSEGS